MNPDKLVERTSKSFNLKVFKVDDGSYYVENSSGKVCYKILLDEGTKSCTCADFQKHIHQDPDFRCCHIIAVLNSAGDPEQVKYIQRYKPKLDKQFITQFQGKDFVLYAGLLDLAHQKGIRRIDVDVEQFPTSENCNVAVCRASVESIGGEKFIEWGDANPKNVNSKIAPHILRMAATRAKARALRDFTNIGMTCMEELGGTEETEVQKPKPESKQKVPVTRTKEPDKQEVTPVEKSRPPSKPIPFNNKQMIGKPTVPEKEKPAPEPIPVSQNQEKRKPSMAQLKAIENLASRRGVKAEMLDDLSIEQFGVKHQYLSQNDASALIRYLQKSA
jgi:hypothetical protein